MPKENVFIFRSTSRHSILLAHFLLYKDLLLVAKNFYKLFQMVFTTLGQRYLSM